jgi:hypothetical protein
MKVIGLYFVFFTKLLWKFYGSTVPLKDMILLHVCTCPNKYYFNLFNLDIFWLGYFLDEDELFLVLEESNF